MNLTDGDISPTDSNIKIEKGLSKSDFEKSNLRNQVLDYQEYGYTRYYIKPQLIDNDEFIMVLLFNPEGIIEFVQLGLTKNGAIPTWDNYSKDIEIDKKGKHDQWLKRKVGNPPYKFSWGEVSSNYDPRSGSSMITIKYKYNT
jgi:hypothetical protein